MAKEPPKPVPVKATKRALAKAATRSPAKPEPGAVVAPAPTATAPTAAAPAVTAPVAAPPPIATKPAAPIKIGADEARALIESRARGDAGAAKPPPVAADPVKPVVTAPPPGTTAPPPGTVVPPQPGLQPKPAPQPKPTAPPPRDPLITELLIENRKFAEANESAEANAKAALSAAERFRTQADAQAQEISALQAQVRQLAEKVSASDAALTRAKAEIAQLKASAAPVADGPTVLTSESVAALLGEFVKDFDTGVGSLRLSSGAITLKAGFTSVGGKAAFVLPSATAAHDKIESLHEIRLQLDPKQGANG